MLVDQRIKEMKIGKSDLADLLKIHRNTLINNLKSPNTTLQFVEELSKSIGVSVTSLLSLDSDPLFDNSHSEVIANITIELYQLKKETQKLRENNEFQYSTIKDLKSKLSKYEDVN